MCGLKFCSVIVVLVAVCIYSLLTPLPPCFDHMPFSIRLSMQAMPKVKRLATSVVEALGMGNEIHVMRTLIKYGVLKGAETDAVSTMDTEFDGIPVRVYTPATRVPNGAAMFYIHGGGWAFGSIDMTDELTRLLAERLNLMVFSVEYRLAPEWPYPAGIDDVERAFRYLANHAAEFNIDASRIAAAGDSAGGNLAAALSTRLRDAALHANDSSKLQPQVKVQILIYPSLQVPNISTVSMLRSRNSYFPKRREAPSFILRYALGTDYDNNETLRAYAEQYLDEGCYQLKFQHMDKVYLNSKNQDIRELVLSDSDRAFLASFSNDEEGRRLLNLKCTLKDEAILNELHSRLACMYKPDFSPLYAESTAGLPATFIVSCGEDVLRDDSFFYVERLREANVLVEHDYQSDMCHGYYTFNAVGSIGPLSQFLQKHKLP